MTAPADVAYKRRFSALPTLMRVAIAARPRLRRVRTPEGARHFDQPIGSIIVPDLSAFEAPDRSLASRETAREVAQLGKKTKGKVPKSGAVWWTQPASSTKATKGLSKTGWRLTIQRRADGRFDWFVAPQHNGGMVTRYNGDAATMAAAMKQAEEQALLMESMGQGGLPDATVPNANDSFIFKRANATDMVANVDGAQVILRYHPRYGGWEVYARVEGRETPLTRGQLTGVFEDGLREAQRRAHALHMLPKAGMKPTRYKELGRRRPKGTTWRDYSYGRRGIDWTNPRDPAMDSAEDPHALAVIALNDARDLGYEVQQPFPTPALDALNEVLWAYHAMYPGFPRLLRRVKVDNEGMHDEPVAWNLTLPPRFSGGPGERIYTELNFNPRMWMGQIKQRWDEERQEWVDITLKTPLPKGTKTRFRQAREDVAQLVIDTMDAGFWSGQWDEAPEDMPEWRRAFIHTMHHELGHTVHDAGFYRATPERQRAITDLLESFGIGYYRPSGTPGGSSDIFVYNPDKVGALLSKYGATNLREFFAEIWAEYQTSPEPREWVAQIGALLADNLADYLARHKLDSPIEAKRMGRDGVEVKDRVRTPAGVRKYRQPLGTEIIPDAMSVGQPGGGGRVKTSLREIKPGDFITSNIWGLSKTQPRRVLTAVVERSPATGRNYLIVTVAEHDKPIYLAMNSAVFVHTPPGGAVESAATATTRAARKRTPPKPLTPIDVPSKESIDNLFALDYMFDRRDAAPLAARFAALPATTPEAKKLKQALRNPVRLHLLALITASPDHEASPTDLGPPTGLSNIAGHLKVLVDAGLLETERRGQWAYYRLAGMPRKQHSRYGGTVPTKDAVAKSATRRLIDEFVAGGTPAAPAPSPAPKKVAPKKAVPAKPDLSYDVEAEEIFKYARGTRRPEEGRHEGEHVVYEARGTVRSVRKAQGQDPEKLKFPFQSKVEVIELRDLPDRQARAKFIERYSNDEITGIGRALNINDAEALAGTRKQRIAAVLDRLDRLPQRSRSLGDLDAEDLATLGRMMGLNQAKWDALTPEEQDDYIQAMERIRFNNTGNARMEAGDILRRLGVERQAPFMSEFEMEAQDPQQRLLDLAVPEGMIEGGHAVGGRLPERMTATAKAMGFTQADTWQGGIKPGMEALVFANGAWQRGVVKKKTYKNLYIEYLTHGDTIRAEGGTAVKPKTKIAPPSEVWIRFPHRNVPPGSISPAAPSFPTPKGHVRRGDEVLGSLPTGDEWLTVTGLDSNFGTHPILWVRDKNGDARWIEARNVQRIRKRRGSKWYDVSTDPDAQGQFAILEHETDEPHLVFDAPPGKEIRRVEGRRAAEQLARRMSAVAERRYLREVADPGRVITLGEPEQMTLDVPAPRRQPFTVTIPPDQLEILERLQREGSVKFDDFTPAQQDLMTARLYAPDLRGPKGAVVDHAPKTRRMQDWLAFSNRPGPNRKVRLTPAGRALLQAHADPEGFRGGYTRHAPGLSRGTTTPVSLPEEWRLGKTVTWASPGGKAIGRVWSAGPDPGQVWVTTDEGDSVLVRFGPNDTTVSRPREIERYQSRRAAEVTPPAGAPTLTEAPTSRSWRTATLPNPGADYHRGMLSIFLLRSAGGQETSHGWQEFAPSKMEAEKLAARGWIHTDAGMVGARGDRYFITERGRQELRKMLDSEEPGYRPSDGLDSEKFLIEQRQQNEVEALLKKYGRSPYLGTRSDRINALLRLYKDVADGHALGKTGDTKAALDILAYIARDLVWQALDREDGQEKFYNVTLELKQAIYGQVGGRVAHLLDSHRPEETKDAEEARKTGAMIALLPSKGWAQRMALPGGEKPEELHVTLAFLGQANDWTYGQRDGLVSAVKDAANGYGQMLLRAFSVSVFNPKTDNACLVLGVGGPNLNGLKNQIWAQLENFGKTLPKQHTPWVPHMTLAYLNGGLNYFGLSEAIQKTGIVMFDRIGVYFGDQIFEVPLTGKTAATEAEVEADRETKALHRVYVENTHDVSSYNDIVMERDFGRMIEGKKLPESDTCMYCKAKATKLIQHSEGMAYIPACDDHFDRAKHDAEMSTPDHTRDPSNIDRIVQLKDAMDDLAAKGLGRLLMRALVHGRARRTYDDVGKLVRKVRAARRAKRGM